MWLKETSSPVDSASRPASHTTSLDHQNLPVPSSTTDSIRHDSDPPVFNSGESVSISQQGLANVDNPTVPHAELHIPVDAAEGVQGGEETKLVVSGDEHNGVNVVSETEVRICPLPPHLFLTSVFLRRSRTVNYPCLPPILCLQQA